MVDSRCLSGQICVSFSQPDVEQFLSEYPEVELIELRMDLMHLADEQIIRLFSLPVKKIAVCRPHEPYSEAQRLVLLKKAVSAGADYVDIEIENNPAFIATIKEYIESFDCKLILSYHNYEETPSDKVLFDIVEACKRHAPHLIKIATTVAGEEDNHRLKVLYRLSDSLIIIGMGEKGRITRIKACEWGAPFTYAAPSSSGLTAPGQLSYQEMKALASEAR